MTNKDACPLIDLGNYPVIFAADIIIEKIGDGLADLALIQYRRNDAGQMERVIVGRLIRPTANVIAAARILQILQDAPMQDTAMTNCVGGPH